MDPIELGDLIIADPEWLAIAAAIPAALLVFGLGVLGRRRAVRRFGVAGARLRNGRRFLALSVVMFAAAAMAFAAARPQWGEAPTSLRRQGVDIVVALDVSLSMLSPDIQPSRLDRAKDEVDALFGELRGDRVGLVTFAGGAVVRFPLTTDIEAARQLVRTTTVDTTLGPGTNLASAINATRTAFISDPSTTKVVLLITDGEQLAGGAVSESTDTALEVARARDEGIEFIVAGVGTEEGGLIPVRDPASGAVQFRIDAETGEPAVTRLDEESLRQIAEDAGGEYISIGDEESLGAVAERIAALQASAFFEESQTRFTDRFQIFAGAALALVVAQPLLARLFATSRAPRRPAVVMGATLAVGVFVAAACGGDRTAELNEEGNERYSEEQFEDALESYREAQVERPDLPELNYNAANALFRNADLERAIEEAQRALNTSDTEVLARAYYSLGNMYASLNRWQEARAAYRNSLIYNPFDVDTKYNLELANRQITQAPSQSPTPTPTPPPDEGSGPNDPQDGEATPGPEGTPSGDPGSPGGTPTPGDAGGPRPDATPQAPGDENPSAISSEEEQALRDALAQLDPGDPYDIEEALRILDMLRRAGEGRASELPEANVVGERDW